MSFFAELKRRHVYRVAILYLVVGWLVLQVTDVLMSLLTLPVWTGRTAFMLMLLAAVGMWKIVQPKGNLTLAVINDEKRAHGRRNDD